MSDFKAAGIGGLAGAAVVLLASLVGGFLQGEAGSAGPQGPAGAGDLGSGAILLARSAAECPTGWAPGGRVGLITSPEYSLGDGQKRGNPGITTSATAGFDSVQFFLCVRGTQ